MIIVTGFTDLSAEAHRNQTAALLATAGPLDLYGTPSGLTVAGGVHSGFNLSQDGPLTGLITPGRAVIPATTPEDGAYVVTMTEVESFAVDPGDGTYTRRDLVCLQIDEVPVVDPEDPNPPVVSGASIIVVKGTGVTGTTTPPTPDTPANAIPLWVVQVRAGDTAASGGYLAGSVIDKRLRLKLANQDRQPFAMAAGEITVTVPKSAASGSAAITFPAGRFRFAPIVTASLVSAANGTGKLSARVLNRTTTGGSVYVYTGDATAASTSAAVTCTVHWQAIQMAEDAAAG